ncbi:MAG: quinone-dependent dihydroorotate dehydrogenase [Sphingomonas bacterium]
MPTAYDLIRPAIFRLDPENAHRLTIAALRLMPRVAHRAADPALAVEVAGLHFPNPLGMAAGFDKDAEVADALLSLGFGFAEVGTITPLPQPGNPRPRLFRLTEDRAVINRFGFNSKGGEAAARRLAARPGRPGIVGVNIGANKDSADRIADYVAMARMMAPYASYLTLNISSPNTPGLRALQDVGALHDLLDRVIAEVRGAVPIFLKVAPDLQPADVDAIARAVLDRQLGALMVSNTTITRPPLKSAHSGEAGGLSGAPLRLMALERLRDFRKATGGALPLIAIGGIATADHAWESIRAGASLVQLYSAMVYEGPGIARRVVRGLAERLRREGMMSIGEAVGSGA